MKIYLSLFGFTAHACLKEHTFELFSSSGVFRNELFFYREKAYPQELCETEECTGSTVPARHPTGFLR